VIIAGPVGDKALAENPDGEAFLMDACRHLKAIGLSGVPMLAKKAHLVGEVGVTELESSKNIPTFIEFARAGKVWDRELGVALPPAGAENKK
jgi:hypothetical protein